MADFHLNRDRYFTLFVLLFVAGTSGFYQQSQEPPSSAWLAALALFGLGHYTHFIRLIMAPLLGFYWAWLWLWLYQPADLPADLIQKEITVQGQIIGLPKNNIFKNHFILAITKIKYQDQSWEGHWRVELNWYQPEQPVRSGEYWSFRVKLKPIISLRNPGSFDYAGWRWQQGIQYRGYVRGEAHQIGFAWRVDSLRQSLATAIDDLELPRRSRAVIKALLIGDKSDLRYRDRQLFAQTGTSHLIAISGLHIGFVAGLSFLGFHWLWRRSARLTARYPASIAASLFALLAATAYAALAGFSLPTQRALIMLAIASIALIKRRHVRKLRIWSLTLLIVTLWSPISVLSAGYWLSFIAVALLLFFAAQKQAWRGALKTQLIISFGLAPVLLWQNMSHALHAPLINLIYIPLFGTLIVPLTLLGGLLLLPLPEIGRWLLHWDGQLIAWALTGLELLQKPEWLIHPDDDYAFEIAVLALLFTLWLSAKLKPYFVLLGLLLILAHQWRPEQRLREGEFHFYLFDVAQGLAAMVQTKDHVLIYDTGFGYRFNAAHAVILPFLKQQGIDRIDLLMVSHSDKDHAGGAFALFRNMTIDEVLSGEPQRLRIPAQPCYAGQSWYWNQVHFQVLYPPRDHAFKDNAASCVLKISSGKNSLLLTGDISQRDERRLLKQAADIQAQIVVAPHHGSAYSSSPGFIAAVQPDWVLYSAGAFNRWNFPRPETVARWQPAKQLNTAASGMIQFLVNPQKISLVQRYALDQQRLWWYPLKNPP